MKKEDLLFLIFGFYISGIYIYPENKKRRLATAEEQKMWAALMHQAGQAIQPASLPGEEQ